MAKTDGAAAQVLRNKVKAAEDALAAARQQYRQEVNLDPARIDDNVFASEWAKKIDTLQRNVTKFSTMQDIYEEGDLTTHEDGEDPVEPATRRERVNAGLGRLKDTMVRAAQQGMASAVVKQVADEALLALGDNCPPMILMLPEAVREACLCALVYMAAEAYPGIPMASQAGAVSLLALEATASKTFAEATAVLTPRLAGMFKNLSLLPAAAGAGLLIAATTKA